jgi:hypothetical protein
LSWPGSGFSSDAATMISRCDRIMFENFYTWIKLKERKFYLQFESTRVISCESECGCGCEADDDEDEDDEEND